MPSATISVHQLVGGVSESGRRSTIGNRVNVEAFRGFESHPLRFLFTFPSSLLLVAEFSRNRHNELQLYWNVHV